MTPVVRLASSHDVAACEDLESQARAETAGTRGAEAFFAEQPAGVFVDQESAFTLVATLDDVIVGFASLREHQAAGSRVANVVRVYVTTKARRIGVGDALINGAKDTARARGCSRIDALALPGDRDTKNLFERNGLTARLIVASRPL